MDPLTAMIVPLLFAAGKSLFGGLAGMAEARQLANRQRLQQRELELTARAEEARAEQLGLQRLRAVNRAVGANLARAGALGISQSDSLHALAQTSFATAARETQTDFVNAGVQAAIARARAAQADPDLTESMGWFSFFGANVAATFGQSLAASGVADDAGDGDGLFRTLRAGGKKAGSGLAGAK